MEITCHSTEDAETLLWYTIMIYHFYDESVLCSTRHDAVILFTPAAHMVQAVDDNPPTEVVDVPAGHDTHAPRFR